MVRKHYEAKWKREGRSPTIIEHLILEVGVIKSAHVVADLAGWTMARQKHGRPPTWEEYRDVCGWSVPTTFRAQKRLREIFGGDEGIGRVADLLEANESAAAAVVAMGKTGFISPELAMICGDLPFEVPR
jgi:hypothetical protein